MAFVLCLISVQVYFRCSKSLSFHLLDFAFDFVEARQVLNCFDFPNSVIEVGFAAKALRLQAKNVIQNSSLQHVVNGAQIEFASIEHRYDLPVALAVP